MPSFLLSLLLISTCFIGQLQCLTDSDEVPSRTNMFDKSAVFRQDLKTLGAHLNAESLLTALRKLANKEMGVPIMQGIIDGLAFNKANVNKNAIVNEMATKLNETFNLYGTVLRNARDDVQIYYGKHPVDMQVFRPSKECCRLRNDELRYDPQFGSRVNMSFACDVLSPSDQPQFLFYPSKNLTTMYQHNAATLPGLRWQYFISSAGSHIEYPAHSFDPLGALTGASCVQRESVRHRAPYLSSALPYPKRVVILLDYGSGLSDAQLLKIQTVGKILLESFSGRDRVTVLAMSSKVIGPCGSEIADLWDPTSDGKEALVSFIDGLNKTEEFTNHSMGLEEAYKVLIHAENSLSARSTPETVHNFIMYVSRGLLTSLTEAGTVLSTMANLNVNTYIRVHINTFALVDKDKTPLLWAGQFLRDVAEQNFEKYRHSMSEQLRTKLKDAKINPPKGKLISVDDSEGRSVTLTKVFESLKTPEAALEPSYRTIMSWSSPPNEQGDPVVSATMPVWHKDDFVGVIGHDLNLNVIADGLKYADLPDNSKARLMLTDLEGRVLVDSRLRDGFVRPASVADLEGWSKSDRWKAIFASEDVFQGSFELSIPVDANTTRKVSYTWQKLESAPFVVLLASEMGPRMASLERRSVQTLSLRKVVYHRLDLQLNSDIRTHCTLMDQLSTIERGSVYLGPSCFTSPHAHMSSDKNTRSKQATRASGYWVYLGDGAGLIRNTGIRPGVREDVGALASIVDEWQQRFASSPYQKHILRRFVATNRGVMVTFPATVFTDDFDPTERHWYKRALQYPGRIVLTGPYLDSSAGDIVTISHTIYEGEGAAMHLPDDQVFAVMGMDVSIDFLYKILNDSLSVCRLFGRRCMLFEDTGYLVARGDPFLNQGNRTTTADTNASPLYAEREPIEGAHVTHREPSLAIHLLQNGQFMRKITCKQFASQTHQRLYQFNTSYTDAIRMTGESPSGCTRSEVIPVPRTNTFLAVLDHTCDVHSSVQSAFCPCSVSDRRCLLCSRIDPLECECPCECPMKNAGSARCSTDEIAQSPVCDAPESQSVTPSSARDPNLFAKLALLEGTNGDKHLTQCVPIRCEQHTTVDKCYGVLGCQWCLRAEDGRRLLPDPFCSPIDQCFGGVRGRSIHGYRIDDEVLSAISTPVGPVAGAIMGVFVLLVVGVYCYRHQVTRLVESRVTAGSGSRLYPNADDDDDEIRFDHEGSKVGDDDMDRAAIGVMQLASFERNSIPRAQYRPGPRTESSDHGYSTMTDRMAGDESERGTTIELGAAPLSKPRPPRTYRMYDKSDSGTKLLVDEESESAIDSNNDDDNSAASSAPTGQTTLNDSSFCESRIVTTTADVHAVEAL